MTLQGLCMQPTHLLQSKTEDSERERELRASGKQPFYALHEPRGEAGGNQLR